MVYDNKTLFEIRYPVQEDDRVPVLKLLAILDCKLQVGALVNAFKIRELSIDMMDSDGDVGELVKSCKPDIVMINPDVLSTDRLKEINSQIRNSTDNMPVLVTIGLKTERAKKLGMEYSAHIHLMQPVYPPRDAEFLEKYFLTRVISREYYVKRIRRMVDITLSAMHCNSYSTGYKYLVDGVTMILTEPYHYFGANLSKRIAEIYDEKLPGVNNHIKSTIDKAVILMTDAEYFASFGDYDDIIDTPSNIQFMYAAARLASRPCRDILVNLNDEPFEYPQRKIKYVSSKLAEETI